MMKRSAKTQKIRTRLLDTASKLFRAQGFHATGLDQILRRSRTPKGSLYHYFPGGKDELAIETVRYVASEMGQTMFPPIDNSHNDPLKIVQNLFESLAKNLLESDYRFGCPIAVVTLETSSDRPSIREACEQGFQMWQEILVEHFRRSGITETRAKSIAMLVLASLEGGLILSRAQKSVKPLDAIARELAHLFRPNISARV